MVMKLVNGAERAAIDANDRGLMYGDGVFRTFPLHGGKAWQWNRQYAKLAADCQALRITCPAISIFADDLATITARHSDCVVKIIVTRGTGPRGYALPDKATATRIVTATPLPGYSKQHAERGVRVHLCRLRLSPQPALAGIKHLNRLENVLARAEWSDPDIAEGILCDADDNVVGGTMTNLFAVKDGTLSTPGLMGCGVAGVTRELVMELAQENRTPVRIAAISIDELLAADEVLLVNSVIGVWQIAALGSKTWNPGRLTPQVRNWLRHDRDD